MGDTVDDLDFALPGNCPSPYFDTWDRHNSIAFSATKGLRNAPGENNCFVNCAVQVFWHLDVFRRSYRRLSGHTCMGNSCIFCALKVIFTQFQYSDKASLHPDALRKALAETFANQHRFQLGHMDDAAECFENILRRIHFHVACNFNEDGCTAPHCLPHQKFSMAVHEKVVCPCGASSSPLKFGEMVHYVSASALVAQSRMIQENGDALHPDRFGLLLRKASAVGDVRDCPANCGKQVQKQRTLLNIPDVVSVGLVWDSDHPSLETTTEVAGALGTAILLQDMYHRVMPDIRKLPRLQLVAVVCYYGKHYSTFVLHSKLKTWVYFDDAVVRNIGPQWENVVEMCSRGRFQPLLLLYANPSANPVSVETAPRKRVMAPGYAPEENDSGLNRTKENIKGMGSSARRSTTPTLKAASQNNQLSHAQETPAQGTGGESPAKLSREHSRQPSFLFAVGGRPDRNKQGEDVEGVKQISGDTVYPAGRRHMLDGGARIGHPETVTEDGGDYTDYTLSSGDQYRRPSLNSPESKIQLPMPPNLSRYPDAQRKDSFTKRAAGKEKGGVDVVRYQIESGLQGHPPADVSSQCHEVFPHQKGDMAGHLKPAVHHGHQRSLSSGREEDGTDVAGGNPHVVVKPKPTGHGNYEAAAEAASHTAVQSGLATLPRQKGHNNSNESSHQRSSSTHQEVAQLTRKSNRQCMPVDPPLPPGTPPPEYNSAVQESSQPHCRQASVSSQSSSMKSSVSIGHIDQAASSKKTDVEKSKKKTKKEKKTEKDPSKKSEKKKSKSDSALKKSESESDLLVDKCNKYIDRRMVETILKHQGVHRQNSSCSNNSVSSVESDSLMGKLLASKSNDILFDNMSLGSQKDSGYGSSDRNSSSSTGSGTVDPYTQYFISKSMVIPRSVNTQHLTDQQQYNKGSCDYGGHLGNQREDGRLIMHPIKESSQEDMLRLSPNEPIGTQKFIIANSAPQQPDAKLPPVPPKNFAQFQIIKSSQQAGHERESSLDSLDKDETVGDNFVSLCKKADVLMDSCMLAETSDDIASASHYCDSALGCLKEAMAQKDLNSKALAYVQKKHNSCLLKLRSLQKRTPTTRQDSFSSGVGSVLSSHSVGKRSSITSSDSDMSDQLSKQQQRPDSRGGVHHHRGHHPSQDFKDSRSLHELHNSTSRHIADNCRQGHSSDTRTSGYYENLASGTQKIVTPVVHDNGANHHRTDSGGPYPVPQSNSANYLHGSGMNSGGNSADLYGTLPRNKSRKPTSDTPASAEVYQSFLNKQKCLQAGVTASQQSLDSLKSDSGSEHSSAGGGQQKMTNTDRRQLLQESLVHQRQLPTAGHQYPHHQPATPVQHSQHGQLSQRPAQTFVPNGQHPQPGLMGWQQHQQHAVQAYPQPPSHQRVPSSYQLHNQQQQRQPPQHPSRVPVHNPAQNVPPTPGQKPSIPYMSTVKPSPPSCQGPTSHPHHDISEVGRYVALQNVGRVAPSMHTASTCPQDNSNNNLMMPPSFEQTHAAGSRCGSQVCHSFSSVHMAALALTPSSKPLQRCASQPDCQNLVDSVYPANQSDYGAHCWSKRSSSLLPFAPLSEQHHLQEGSMDSQRLQSSGNDADSEAEKAAVSVRALASRFEKTDSVLGSRPYGHRGNTKSDSHNRLQGSVSVQRTRSKSESFSRKPKSVLKNKKNKSRPGKSVTFAESLAHYSNCDDVNSGYESARELSSPRVATDDRAYYSDDDDRLGFHASCYSDNELDDVEDTGSSNSDESPLGEEDACQLCHKRRSDIGNQFCAKCNFYMSKLNLS